MSENKTNAPKDLIDDGKNVTISKERSRLAVLAAAEISEITHLIRKANERYHDNDLAIRGLLLRVNSLTNIVSAALCDDAETTQELAYSLTGEHVEPVAA